VSNRKKFIGALILALLLWVLAVPVGALGQDPSVVTPSGVVTAPASGSGATPAPPPVAPPAIGAKSAVMINADDGRILYSLNPDERLPMASTTKMMTALMTIENHGKSLTDVVTCSQRCAEVGESSIWLTAGEKLSVKDMLMGMLIQSGNDAATALAEYDAGSVEGFVAKMNDRAAAMGLSNTHFANPHGLDDPEHYTSAADFTKLARELMRHQEIREIVKLDEAAIPWPGQPYSRDLINHNHLLDLYPAVNGIKTGYTDAAGQCIIISASEGGTNLILSYMGGASLPGRNEDVINMLAYGFASYRQQTVISGGAEYSAVDLPYNYGRKLPLVSEADLVKKVYIGNTVEQKIVLPDHLDLPVHKGDKIGLVEAFEGPRYLGSTYLLATEDVPPPGFKDRITYYIEAVYNFLLSAIKLG